MIGAQQVGDPDHEEHCPTVQPPDQRELGEHPAQRLGEQAEARTRLRALVRPRGPVPVSMIAELLIAREESGSGEDSFEVRSTPAAARRAEVERKTIDSSRSPNWTPACRAAINEGTSGPPQQERTGAYVEAG
jgi:hypothetical protein